MKKILAIAISLVMVFAVAASAMALFGFKANATPILVDDYEVDVELYDNIRTAAGNSMIRGWYPTHAPTSGVRAGETYVASVYVYMPAFNDLTNFGRQMITAAGDNQATLRITTSNLTGFDAPNNNYASAYHFVAPTYLDAGTPAVVDEWGQLPVNDTLTIDKADLNAFEDGDDVMADGTAYTKQTGLVPDAAGDLESEFWFAFECRIRTLADATVSAVFGAPDPDVTTVSSTCMIGNWGVRHDSAYPTTTSYTMEEYSSDNTGAFVVNGNQVIFAVGTPDNAGNFPILNTWVTDGTDTFRVAQEPATGDIIYIAEAPTARGTALNAKSTDANELALFGGILTRAMAAMGFTWTPDGVLYDEGFEALAARGLQFSDSATFYAYTAALTVAGTATVPDTGDNTVVGIVMMAVAVLATAAIVIKKVRA